MPNTDRAISRYILQVSIFVLIFAASLFVSAGRSDWAMGWIFIAIVAASQTEKTGSLGFRMVELKSTANNANSREKIIIRGEKFTTKTRRSPRYLA